MRKVHRVAVIVVGLIAVLHGIAHAPGALGSLDLATFEDASRQPNLLFTAAGDSLILVLGMLWAVAGVLFILGGIGVALNRNKALPVVALALAVSLPLTILWYQDAVAGLVLNIVLLAAVLFAVATGTSKVQGERVLSPG